MGAFKYMPYFIWNTFACLPFLIGFSENKTNVEIQRRDSIVLFFANLCLHFKNNKYIVCHLVRFGIVRGHKALKGKNMFTITEDIGFVNFDAGSTVSCFLSVITNICSLGSFDLRRKVKKLWKTVFVTDK